MFKKSLFFIFFTNFLFVLCLSFSCISADLSSLEVYSGSSSDRIASFEVELAQTPKDMITGLMHRTSLDLNKGMLFDFGSSVFPAMWMKETLLSLDMLFIDEEGKIVQIAKDTTPLSLNLISADYPCRYVLEINAGASNNFGIKEGYFVKLTSPKENKAQIPQTSSKTQAND